MNKTSYVDIKTNIHICKSRLTCEHQQFIYLPITTYMKLHMFIFVNIHLTVSLIRRELPILFYFLLVNTCVSFLRTGNKIVIVICSFNCSPLRLCCCLFLVSYWFVCLFVYLIERRQKLRKIFFFFLFFFFF